MSQYWLVESFQPYSKKNVVYYNFYRSMMRERREREVG